MIRIAVIGYGQIVESIPGTSTNAERPAMTADGDDVGSTSAAIQAIPNARGGFTVPVQGAAASAALDLRTTLTANKLERHLDWYAQQGYQGITLDDLAAIKPDAPATAQKRLALTFDGGYPTHYSLVLPLLQRFIMRATFFVPRDMLDRPGGLSRRGLETLAKHGMQLGVLAPPAGDMLRMLPPALEAELSEPRRLLAEIAGGPITTCATAARQLESPMLRTLAAHEFSCVALSEVGNHLVRDGMFTISRYTYRKSINPDDWKNVAKCSVSGPAKTFFQVLPV